VAQEWKTPDDGIDHWLRWRFGLSGSREKDIWLLCIAVAIELEGLAVGVLWVEDGKPGNFHDYAARMTLGAAKDQLERRGLLDAATNNILKAVADLRNSVVHRHVGFPAPAPHSGPPVGRYRGQDVFKEEAARAQLRHDVFLAAQTMWSWIANGHLALQAKRRS
jgi:hypothetical protein